MTNKPTPKLPYGPRFLAAIDYLIALAERDDDEPDRVSVDALELAATGADQGWQPTETQLVASSSSVSTKQTTNRATKF